MTHIAPNLTKLAVALGAGAISAFVGCQYTGDTPACADIPHGAVPQLSGTYTCQWQSAQAARAEQDEFVIYLNEWLQRGPVLGPCGQDHVKRLANRLPHCDFQVLIQPSGDPQLDMARHQAVIEFLATRGVANPGDRVVIFSPEAEGLYGFEAPRIVRGYGQTGTFGAGTGGRGVGFGGGGNFGFGGGYGAGFGGGGIY